MIYSFPRHCLFWSNWNRHPHYNQTRPGGVHHESARFLDRFRNAHKHGFQKIFIISDPRAWPKKTCWITTTVAWRYPCTKTTVSTKHWNRHSDCFDHFSPQSDDNEHFVCHPPNKARRYPCIRMTRPIGSTWWSPWTPDHEHWPALQSQRRARAKALRTPWMPIVGHPIKASVFYRHPDMDVNEAPGQSWAQPRPIFGCGGAFFILKKAYLHIFDRTLNIS